MAEKILIIGAGASGLYAAKALVDEGHDVAILEARNRVGGRIFTTQEGFSAPIDVGAEFVHGNQKLTRKLLSESRTESRNLGGEWKQVTDGEVGPMDQSNERWQNMIDQMDSLNEDQDLFSFLQTYFNKPEDVGLRESVTRFVEGYDAADSHRVSVFALREEWKGQDDEEQAQIVGGYGTIISFLAAKIAAKKGRIILDFPVKTIRWRKGFVTIEGTDERAIIGTKVLITVPIATLQHGSIRFEPKLPFQKNVFAGFGVGGVIKFIYEFKTSFWKHARNNQFKDASFFTSDADIPTWWTSTVTTNPILVGWLGGPSTFSRQNDKELLHEEALQSLAYIFDMAKEKIRSQLVTKSISDWINDPWARGAYAYSTVNTAEARDTLLIPIDDTIFFAGEALYDGPAMGTVEAAFESARGAVKRMLGRD